MDSESLYWRLPIWMQHAACGMEGWRIQRRRYGRGFCALLAEVEQRTHWSAEELFGYRDRQIRDYVRYCAAFVPYYRDWFALSRIDPRDVRGLEDLRVLPIIRKGDVQAESHRFVAEGISPRHRVAVRTSGTTGAGLRFFATLDAIKYQWAVWWRYRRWHGIERGTWCGYLGGRVVVPRTQNEPPFWRYNAAGKQLMFSGYHMSPRNLGAYVDELRKRRPPWLHGYPSLLSLLASYIVDKGVDLSYAVRWITIGAECLLPYQSDVMERAFGVRPVQHYGMTESTANISECERGKLHVDEDFAAVEFVRRAGSDTLSVIGSGWTNPATGLLRYDVEDVIALSDERCDCGRAGRIVARVDGRSEDYIVLGDGTRVSCANHIFKWVSNVREAQIYQARAGEVTVRVVRGGGYGTSDEERLVREVRRRTGRGTEISVEYVTAVERSATGKLRLVISEVPEGRSVTEGD